MIFFQMCIKYVKMSVTKYIKVNNMQVEEKKKKRKRKEKNNHA